MKASHYPTRVVSMALENRKEFERFFKFAVVGAVGAMVDFIVLNILVQLLGMAPVYANPFSFSAAVASNFTWNRLWTFPESRERRLREQLPKFALVNLIGLGINQAIFVTMLHTLMPRLHITHPFDYNLAKLLAIGVVLFWNFGVNRLWTYRGL
jgi:putative flippase GtrA